MQLVNGKWLQTKALDQWTRDLPMTAERGKIFDANGSTLCASYTTYDVYVRGREVREQEKVATFLSNLLKLPYLNVLKKVNDKNISESLIKLQVEKEKADVISQSGYKGIFLSENIKRFYPYGDFLSQVLGFTSIDNRGQAGIEAYYDNMLRGIDGKVLVQSDLQGKELEGAQRSYVPSVAGMNINLTINAQIQLAVERALNKVMIEHKAKSATAIMMDPKTGQILALSSKPSVDLNHLPRNDVSALMESVKNKAVIDVYEPGSTFKVLTTAAALEEKKTSFEDRFYDPGYRIVDGQKIKCWKTIGHGNENLVEGFCNSCNSVFMDLALRLGTDKFYDYLTKFGIGSKTGVEIAGESSGILMNKKNVKKVDLARIGFGQAVAVTPLQLLSSFCATINGGNLVKPYLVENIFSKDDEQIVKGTTKTKGKVISLETSKMICTLLENVANKQGKSSFVEGYRIGGKTGTAQKYENGQIARGKYVSSFFGTYPAMNPDYALLFLVDEPMAGAYFGSVVAAPYAKEIFADLFKYLNISPVYRDGEKGCLEKNIKMPSLYNKSLSEAISILTSLCLNYEIESDGGIVLDQLPPVGTMLHKYQTVILKT
ncbi:MAG: penicillin-binding transpeptidase domain-containing protein [Clostridia bacterium]